MKIRVDPGGTRWVKWAKAQLYRLEALRKDLHLPAMVKSFILKDRTLIAIKSSDFEDRIYISGSPTHGGFIIYPSATQLVSPFTVFTYFDQQERMPVVNREILTFVDYTKVSQKYRPITEVTYTEASSLIPAPDKTLAEWIVIAGGQATWDFLKAFFGYTDQQLVDALNAEQADIEQPGYFTDEVFAEVTDPVIDVNFMPFNHEYTEALPAPAHPATKILTLMPHIANPSVYEIDVLAALTQSGSLTYTIDDISPEGRTGVGLQNDTKATILIDYVAGTQVVKSEETLSGYGSDRVEYNDTWFFFNGPLNIGTNGNRQYSTTETLAATYPVCFGYSGSNVSQSIDLRHTLSSTVSVEFTFDYSCTVTSLGGDGTGSTASTGSTTSEFVETKILALPGGISKTFDIKTQLVSGNGEQSKILGNDGTSGVGCDEISTSGSGSVTYNSIVLGEVEVLYADASIPAAVYRYTKKTYNTILSAATGFLADLTATYTKEITVALLIGNSEVTIYSDSEPDIANDYAYDLSYMFLAGATSGNFPSSGGTTNTDNTTPLDFNFSTIKARLQAAPLSIAIQSQDHYVGQYTHSDDTTWIFGTGTPRQALIDRFIGILEAKETALPTPTITAQEQIFLNNLRADTLTDYALNLEKASPQGISLV